MRSNRLGCLTGTGMIAMLVTALVIVGYAYTSGGLMFSPGSLSARSGEMLGGVTSHAEIGKDCNTCHTAPWDSAKMADRCAVCHTVIAFEMQNVASLHGKLTHDNPDLSCRHCHPDHRGADAQLTIMDSALFPHEAVGYSLNGHQVTATKAAFTCDDCHHGDISTFALDSCQTCHSQIDLAFTQAHLLAFGADCLACHDGVDRYGDDFDHSQFTFQLTGKHATVICTECHLDARSIVDLQSLPQDCYSCHKGDDEHAGNFGTDCSACHNPSGWEDATFDHALSNFPLTGAHVNTACEKCHINQQFQGLNTACVACHLEPVYHAGLLGTDCVVCHNTTAWSPAEFNGQHTFPLNHGDGASCATCHPSSLAAYTCYGCHEHDEAEVRSEHLDEGISNFQNCMECHPDGQEHEGGEGGGDN